MDSGNYGEEAAVSGENGEEATRCANATLRTIGPLCFCLGWLLNPAWSVSENVGGWAGGGGVHDPQKQQPCANGRERAFRPGIYEDECA